VVCQQNLFSLLERWCSMSYEFYKEVRQLDKHPAYRMKVPFGVWRTRTLEILQTVFTPMYRRVFESNWNNSMYATMVKPYYYCDFEQGIYEVYIPTTIDAFNRMHYWRIAVKVYDKIDKDLVEANQHNLETPYVRPLGVIDSETVCHLARTQTNSYRNALRELYKQGGRKAWFKGLLRGFKHKQKKGYFSPIIVHESPDIAVKRLLSLIYNFMKTRFKAFLKKLKLQPWMYEEMLEKRNLKSLLILVKDFSLTICTITKSLYGSFDWIRMKLKDLYAEIGRQTVQKSKIRPLIEEIRQIVDVFRQQNSLRNVDVPDPPILQRLVAVLQT
jgi:hypothetical protein